MDTTERGIEGESRPKDRVKQGDFMDNSIASPISCNEGVGEMLVPG